MRVGAVIRNIWRRKGTVAYYLGGRVGIGTKTPVADLEVCSTTGAAFIHVDADGSSNCGIRFVDDGTVKWTNGYQDSTGDFTIYDAVNGKNIFRIKSGTLANLLVLDNDKVGIGTATPTEFFELSLPNSSYNAKFGKPAYGLRFASMQSGTQFIGMGVRKAATDNVFISETNENPIVKHSALQFGYNGDIYFGSDPIHRADGAAATLSPRLMIKVGGNVGIGTGAPTQPLDVKTRIGMTAIGGLCIKLTNKSGANSVAGDVVIASTGTAYAVALAGASELQPIGVFLESGVADGAQAWIVVSGIADVHMDAGGSGLGDRIVTSATAGRGDVSNSPSVAVHFQEIGHCIEAVGANANARCVLHFL